MKKPELDELMTAGELKSLLMNIPDDAKIFFGCFSLRYYRIKWRGDNLVQIEFDQTVYDDDGKVYIENHE